MWVAGVDEAGRGPLAGPVVAAAVILDPEREIPGLNDSKKLTAKARSTLCEMIFDNAIAVGVGQASRAEIDEMNILRASLLAMQRAVVELSTTPGKVLCDGNQSPVLDMPVDAVVKGDATVPCISAASIVAKVIRDRIMLDLHARFPAYGFDQHKGYPTKAHRAALARYGPSPEHRRTFAPVSALLEVE